MAAVGASDGAPVVPAFAATSTEFTIEGSTLTIERTLGAGANPITQLPAALASIAVRLTGSTLDGIVLTLEILNVTETDNPDVISQDQPYGVDFRRGDARADGVVDIFDALFSTKGNRGTGLGLTVVRNVMQRHSGEVRLERPEGGGARFVLKFPFM